MNISEIIFKTPLVLLLIPVILGISAVLYARRRPSAFMFSSLELVRNVSATWKMRWQWLPFALRLAVLTLAIVALAGPRKVLEKSRTEAEGIDIVLAIDASGSMAGEDFQVNGERINRLEVVKTVVEDFINHRQHDRIGLVAFGGLAYTVCPLTTDYRWLKENLERIQLDVVPRGTAVGSGIATALNRLKDSEAPSRVIILLTDGANNAGSVEPMAAADAASSLGVKIYTIGAAAKGLIPVPVGIDPWGRKMYQNMMSDLDENLLRAIADKTGAKYFRATDTESLRQGYEEIDRLEKVKIEQVGYVEYKELFGYPLALAMLILLLEVVLSRTVFLKIP